MCDLFEGRGGFNFDLQKRNAALAKKGYHAMNANKTGTTIVGLVCQREKAVVLAADSRSTIDNIVANKECIKIHYIAPNIYCCGAGTAADTENSTLLCSEKLELLRLSMSLLLTCVLYRFWMSIPCQDCQHYSCPTLIPLYGIYQCCFDFGWR